MDRSIRINLRGLTTWLVSCGVLLLLYALPGNYVSIGTINALFSPVSFGDGSLELSFGASCINHFLQRDLTTSIAAITGTI